MGVDVGVDVAGVGDARSGEGDPPKGVRVGEGVGVGVIVGVKVGVDVGVGGYPSTRKEPEVTNSVPTKM